MSGPFVYVGTWRIKDGHLGLAQERLTEWADFVESNEPQVIAFNFYIDEAQQLGSVVQVHPDADSMAHHMELLNKHHAGGLDWLESIVLEQYFGPRSERLNELLAPWEGPDVPVRNVSGHLAGFTRTSVR